jgi:UDP-N-acetylmuramoyl-tripeptide--D-alanyl-D-alanine ligase
VIPLAWQELVDLELGALGGAPGPDGLVHRIHDDSRCARSGDLFVALNTGTRFVGDAEQRGAATLVPRDQHAALAALATLIRSRSPAQVVAVVGSTGKTSTKDALGALCSAVTPTVYADASRNNEIGLPLTVLRLQPDTRVLVTEMGMRGLGQIAELCSIASPTMALVTGIGPEHLELVGSLDAVARANAEAIESLPPGGIAVVPDDVAALDPWLARDDIDVRRFDGRAVERDGEAWRFPLATGTIELELPFDQRHLAENVAAALTAYEALGLPLDRAAEGASQIGLSPWRGEVRTLPGGGLVVNDAYNANPVSMRAALVDLAERAEGRRRVVVLGEMAELGAESGRYHAEIGALLSELGIEVVLGVGAGAERYAVDGLVGWRNAVDAADAVTQLGDLLRPGDAVLVKASRSVGLEGIPERVQNLCEAWSAS